MRSGRPAASISAPPPPPTYSPLLNLNSFQRPRPKARMASIYGLKSVVAEFGQLLWSCTNFRCSDRTLRSRDRFLTFPQEMGKYRRAQIFGQSADILTSRAGTTAGTVRERRRPYKLGGLSLEVTWGLHEREATSPERELFSQTWRKCRAQISRRRAWAPIFWWAHSFGAYIFYKRSNFHQAQRF